MVVWMNRTFAWKSANGSGCLVIVRIVEERKKREHKAEVTLEAREGAREGEPASPRKEKVTCFQHYNSRFQIDELFEIVPYTQLL
jgi:hypothetical protein